MGYRSEVKAAFYSADKSGEQVLADLKAKFPAVFNEWPEGHWHTKPTCLLFEADWVKWYDSYEDVASFKKMTTELSFSEDDNIDWELVRIGEDPDDTEHRHTGDRFILSISRSIEINL